MLPSEGDAFERDIWRAHALVMLGVFVVAVASVVGASTAVLSIAGASVLMAASGGDPLLAEHPPESCAWSAHSARTAVGAKGDLRGTIIVAC